MYNIYILCVCVIRLALYNYYIQYTSGCQVMETLPHQITIAHSHITRIPPCIYLSTYFTLPGKIVTHTHIHNCFPSHVYIYIHTTQYSIIILLYMYNVHCIYIYISHYRQGNLEPNGCLEAENMSSHSYKPSYSQLGREHPKPTHLQPPNRAT